MKDSNADQKIKSENILLLNCIRTERKTSEHIVQVRWKRGREGRLETMMYYDLL